MKVITKGNKKECVIDPEERDLIITANKELDMLDPSKRELIKSIIDYKLSSSLNVLGPDPLFKSVLGNSLKALLSNQSATFLLIILQHYDNLNIVLNKLDEEKLITKKTYDFVFELSAKYGSTLEDIIRFKEDPCHWASYSISPIVISKENIQLQLRVHKMDHQIIQFNFDLEDSIRLSSSFLEEAIETIELIDKELILSFDLKKIEQLEKLTAKMKDLFNSVESDSKQPETSLVESAPKNDN
ncbi:hypothetical protein ASJ81_13920 [Methanosarcina spelaei]|uniref:Uncharacterized protein n=1 Tax=Methanosarcina spelaei TaxID=1036679 RepID=A0A2A2HY63_9EURY|nr:hypothetical protein [Methanosarcina spelaei]PAV14419.1 hypothetical protein ASJ81_13920 [Methanosarcina spelaei]